MYSSQEWWSAKPSSPDRVPLLPYSTRFRGAQYIERQFTEGSATQRCTISMWFKAINFNELIRLWTVHEQGVSTTDSNYGSILIRPGGQLVIAGQSSNYWESANNIRVGGWNHLYVVCDTTASEANKIQVQLNGNMLIKSGGIMPSSNGTPGFMNPTGGKRCLIGVDNTYSSYTTDVKIAGLAYVPSIVPIQYFGTFPGGWTNNKAWAPVDTINTDIDWGANGFFLNGRLGEQGYIGLDNSPNGFDFATSGFTTSSNSPNFDVSEDTPDRQQLFADWDKVPPIRSTTADAQVYMAGDAFYLTNNPSLAQVIRRLGYIGEGKYFFGIRGYERDSYHRNISLSVLEPDEEPGIPSNTNLSADYVANAKGKTITVPYATGWPRVAAYSDGVHDGSYTVSVANDHAGAFACYNSLNGYLWLGYYDGSAFQWFNGTDWTLNGDPESGQNPTYILNPGPKKVYGHVITSDGAAGSTAFIHRPNWTSASGVRILPPSGFDDYYSNVNDLQETDTGTSFCKALIGSGNDIYDLVDTAFGGDTLQGLAWVKNRSTNSEWQMWDGYNGESLLANCPSGNVPGSKANMGNPPSAYVWDATQTNTFDGSGGIYGNLPATVRSNPEAGFSIVTYTGDGVNNRYVAHNLTKRPEVLIHKDLGGQSNFIYWHHNVGNNTYLALNGSAGYSSGGNVWPTGPTDQLIYLGSGGTNVSGNVNVIWAWHSVPGYSKFGTYQGTGLANSEGAYIETGFKPQVVIFKAMNYDASWSVIDSRKSPHNPITMGLATNLDIPEWSNDNIDFHRQGFKIRNTGPGVNGAGYTYIYMAFAENAQYFPTTAR